MDELERLGPVLLPEEQLKLEKAMRRKRRIKWPFSGKTTLIVWATVVGVVLILIAVKWTSSSLKNTDGVNKSAAVANNTGTGAINQSKTLPGLQLNPYKNYGNKYKDGLLPVGDKKYVTDAAKKGYVYLCSANFVPEAQAGAQTRGPWFVNNNTQWDMNKKSQIKGSVMWDSVVTNAVSNGKRVITSNDYPNHKTGVFPVAASDPARKYDANPNSITEQKLSYTLSAGPTYGTPQCMGGEAGIMLTGVPLFSAFDAGGRDAGAWEVQDACDGHPQESGEYHYHTLSRCIESAPLSQVIGYALDGFTITGPKTDNGEILTTDDLDECHGITSEIVHDGKTVTVYHYVMTQDFPYSVSCFRGTPIKPPQLSHSNEESTPGQVPPPHP